MSSEKKRKEEKENHHLLPCEVQGVKIDCEVEAGGRQSRLVVSSSTYCVALADDQFVL